MPLGTTYEVTTEYRAETGKAQRKVEGLASSTNFLDTVTQKAKSTLRSLFRIGSTAAIGGGALGLSSLVRKSIKLGKKAELAKFQVGSMLSTITSKSIDVNEALRQSNALLGLLRERAQGGIKTFGQLRSTMETILPGLAPVLDRGGASREEIAKLTENVTGAGLKFAGSPEEGARQVLRILQGRRVSQSPVFQAIKGPLLDKLGVSGSSSFKDFAERNPVETFKALNSVLGNVGPFLDKIENTFTGLQRQIRGVRNQMSLWIFDTMRAGLKGPMRDFLKWFRDNRSEIRFFSRQLGKGLAGGFEDVARASKLAVAGMDEALGLAAGFESFSIAKRAVGFSSKIGTAIANKVKGAASTIGKKAGQFAATTAVGVALASTGHPLGVALGTAIKFGEVGLLAGELGMNLLGFATQMAAKGAVFATAIGFMREIRLGIEDIVRGVPTARAQRVRDFFQQLGGLKRELDLFARGVGAMNIEDLIFDITDWFGKKLVNALTAGTRELKEFVNTLRFSMQALGAEIKAIGRKTERNTRFGSRAAQTVTGTMALGPLGFLGGFFGPNMFGGTDLGMKSFGNTLMRFNPVPGTRGLPSVAENAKSALQTIKELLGGGGGDGETENNFDIEINQEITTDADPDAIALTTAEVVGEKVQEKLPGDGVTHPFEPER